MTQSHPTPEAPEESSLPEPGESIVPFREATTAMTEQDEKNLVMLAHLSSLAGYVVPLLGVIAPLAIWLWKKDESELVAEHAKESLNFHLTIWIYVTVLGSSVGIGIFCFPFLLAVPFLALLALADVILPIVAAVKANDGEFYRYPLTFRLLK